MTGNRLAGEGAGLPPRTPTRRLCLLDLRQGQRPLEPVNGFVLRGGPTATYQRPCRPSPENKPQLIDCKGPRPLPEVQGWAAKSGPTSLLAGYGAERRAPLLRDV